MGLVMIILPAPGRLVSRGQTFRGKGTSGHYCQHSVDDAGMLA